MPSLRLWISLTLAFAGLAAGTAVLAQTSATARFRSRIDLVALDVCVTDRSGRFLPALSASDFLVLEDQRPQPVTFFLSEGEVPLTAVVLLDRSNSMIGAKLERARAAALTFLRHLGSDDAVAVMAFNQHTERVVPFGTDARTASGLVDHIRPDGTTALFDAILVGLRELQTARRTRQGPRREALVVLSDGEDSASRLAFEEVLEEARRAGVLVYSISIRMGERDRPLPPLHAFARLANDTGGRVVAVRELTALDAIYADIAAELRHMYRLAYVPAASTTDRRWRSVSVRVLGHDARARTRAGYYATRVSALNGGRP